MACITCADGMPARPATSIAFTLISGENDKPAICSLNEAMRSFEMSRCSAILRSGQGPLGTKPMPADLSMSWKAC